MLYSNFLTLNLLKISELYFCHVLRINLHFETTEIAIQQRKNFLMQHNIGICDIVESCERKKMDASDLGMINILLRDMIY